MQIVDTHQHLWDLDLFPYSWLADVPAINQLLSIWPKAWLQARPWPQA